MSELPPGVDIKYDHVKIRVLRGDRDHPFYWYNDCVGQVLSARRKTWYKNGKVTHVNYEVPRTPGGGYNGSIPNENIEVISNG